MADETMPAVDVQEDAITDDVAAYECAFHILPTIADEEVPSVVDKLKSLVARSGGTMTDEEVSERYDLAYEITKQIDGAHRRFNAAHFGWVRFTLTPAALPTVTEEMAHMPEILRYLVIRLTREEAQKPFSLFAARQAQDTKDAEAARNTDAEEGIDRGDEPAEAVSEVPVE